MEEVRLIDANALRLYWLENGKNEYVYDTNAVLDSIDLAPTIEAEPVRHGRWDTSLDGITPFCTECGHTHRFMTRIPNYCPYCGAKMDQRRKRMNEITTADAIKWFEDRRDRIPMPGARAMYGKALAALRAQLEAEKNQTLTMDELREMANKPKMTKAEIIKSLLDQAIDKDILANDDDDSIFALDAKALREAVELIKDVPEWISVKDKVPMVGAIVIATDGAVVGPAYIDSNGQFMRTESHTWVWFYGNSVTHWMPIPKPSEKE